MLYLVEMKLVPPGRPMGEEAGLAFLRADP